MRHLLRSVLGNLPSPNVLRNAIKPENHDFRRQVPRTFTKREQSSDASKSRQGTSEVKGVSSQVLKFINEEVKRSRQASKAAFRRGLKLRSISHHSADVRQEHADVASLQHGPACTKTQTNQVGLIGEATLPQTRPLIRRQRVTATSSTRNERHAKQNKDDERYDREQHDFIRPSPDGSALLRRVSFMPKPLVRKYDMDAQDQQEGGIELLMKQEQCTHRSSSSAQKHAGINMAAQKKHYDGFKVPNKAIDSPTGRSEDAQPSEKPYPRPGDITQSSGSCNQDLLATPIETMAEHKHNTENRDEKTPNRGFTGEVIPDNLVSLRAVEYEMKSTLSSSHKYPKKEDDILMATGSTTTPHQDFNMHISQKEYNKNSRSDAEPPTKRSTGADSANQIEDLEPGQTSDISAEEFKSRKTFRNDELRFHRPDERSIIHRFLRRSHEEAIDLSIISPMRGLKEFLPSFEYWLKLPRSLRTGSDQQYISYKYKQLLFHDQDLPTEGLLADYLWDSLLTFAIPRAVYLNEVVTYAKHLEKRTGKVWKDFYFKLNLRYLGRNEDDPLRWHDALHPTIRPTREQFILLVNYAHQSVPQAVTKLQKIYQQLPFRDLYTPIMHELYHKERFTAAALWHDIFLSYKDLPEDPDHYKPLFQYIVRHGTQKRLAGMVRKMMDQQVPLPTFIQRTMPSNPVAQELVDQQLAATHGITAKPVGDDFHARLFATSWFSTDVVISILRMLGTQMLGPASLRALASKEDRDPQAVSARINQLKDVGITLADSIFCKLVERLCKEPNDRLLESVINCDLHPDTFNDQDLQESLLGKYHATGQRLEFDRTLAILLASCPEKHHTTYYWNLHLRLYLKAKDLKAIVHTLQMMQAAHLPLAIKSMQYTRICLLARRRIGLRPRTTKELSLIINIWQGFLLSGGTMPATVWVEILKRLGMTGRIEEYEKLALWLADWYSSSPAQAYLGGLLKHRGGSTIPQIGHAVESRPPSRKHPHRILFSRAAQQSIVAWGFQHSRVGGPGWRWGLYLLLKLKERNVYVSRLAVAKACRLRLIALFGSGRSNRLINRRQRARNAAQLQYYIQELGKIGVTGLVTSAEQRRLEAGLQ